MRNTHTSSIIKGARHYATSDKKVMIEYKSGFVDTVSQMIFETLLKLNKNEIFSFHWVA